MRGKQKQEPSLWFPQEGLGEAGVAGLGLEGLRSFSGFWSVGAVPGCLTPGSGVMGHMDNGLEYGNLKRDVVGV